MKNVKNKMYSLIMTLLFCALSAVVVADDTDIFSIEKPPATPNVLFVFDNSGSMNWELGSDSKPAKPSDSRLATLRSAFATLLNDPKLPEINMGLMNFSGHTGSWLAHGPSYPVASVNAKAQAVLDSNPLFTHPGNSYLPAPAASDTSKDFLQTIANTWKAKGKTPLVDALYEASLYLKGKDVQWGKKPPNNLRAAHPSTYDGLIATTKTTSTQTVCKKKACGGTTGVVCNSTMQCKTSNKIYHNCYKSSAAACLAAHPSWNSCKKKSGTNCKKTCPDGIYDESGKCVSPQTVCQSYNYFRCDENVNITRCKHEVCANETVTSTLISGNARYKTPITQECQSSHIVLLSDGAPTINNSSKDVENLIGPSYANNCASGTSHERCGRELAKYLAETDHRPDLDGDHAINVDTIGLALSKKEHADAIKYLQDLARNGKGHSYFANDANKLADAFAQSINSLFGKARLFSSPSYTLNKDSILSNGNAVFMPLFKSDTSSVWSGNLKKFTLSSKGELLDSSTPPLPISDKNGTLNKNARDEWAAGVVNDAVTDGGAASQMDPALRKLFSDSGSIQALNASFPGIKAKLGNAGMSNAHRDALLKFIRGYNVDGSARHHIGDIIHSKPVHLRYQGGKAYVFVGTNEGYLHAFDDQTGREVSAFMPSELLKNIEPQYNAVVNKTVSKHLYGVDGPITLWHEDTNQNKIRDAGEDAILIVGLRRGGTSYYALNINNPSKPVLLWKIDSSSSGMSALGHTWSKPVLTHLKYGWPSAKVQPVLIFGGGYSEDASGKEISGKGNAVYIVNAKTGKRVWSASVSNAVPAGIRVLDVDRNGSADRLYFADTGGNIWRADLNAGDLDGSGHFGDINKATVMKFASLGATTTPSSRKFFTEPDVALFKHKGLFVLSLAIGSGERPNPLDTKNDDRFFVLFDQYVLNLPPSSEAAITIADLKAAPVASTVDLISPLRKFKGWYRELAASGISAEKVLSSALTFQNKVMFTSFGMGNSSTVSKDKCELSTTNVSSLYVLDLLNGGAVLDLDGDAKINDAADSSVVVAYGEITDTPQVIFNSFTDKNGGACKKGDCIRPFEIRVGKAVIGFANQNTTSNQVKSGIPRVYWINENLQK